MSYLAKNNANGLLASGISAGATNCTLQAGQGDRFPVVTSPDYTLITFEDAAGNREICKVTARAAASDVLTLDRTTMKEGTTARAWAIGDVVELRMTADLVQTAMGHAAQSSAAHAATAIAFTPGGNISSNNVQAAIAELDSDKAAAGAITGSGLTIGSGKLAGRINASTGALEEIGLGPNFSFSDGNLVFTIPALTSGNITSALGFTPYSNANPNGYINSAGSCNYAASAGDADTLDGQHATAFASASTVATMATSLNLAVVSAEAYGIGTPNAYWGIRFTQVNGNHFDVSLGFTNADGTG